jgi:mRNA interferase RelE/StbE
MKVEFLEQFSKDLDTISDSRTKSKIAAKIFEIEEATSLDQITNLKKLKGFKNIYRIRVGDYRIGLYYERGT